MYNNFPWTDNSKSLKEYYESLDFDKLSKTVIFTRIEPRARDKDYKKALSFEVFDPLWMLCRQWQYGRFKAADGGSPVMLSYAEMAKK